MCVRYGSRQMYFCSEISENISIEMQKELAYTPPLTKREKKNYFVVPKFENCNNNDGIILCIMAKYMLNMKVVTIDFAN